jgi:hypothetical protein
MTLIAIVNGAWVTELQLSVIVGVTTKDTTECPDYALSASCTTLAKQNEATLAMEELMKVSENRQKCSCPRISARISSVQAPRVCNAGKSSPKLSPPFFAVPLDELDTLSPLLAPAGLIFI